MEVFDDIYDHRVHDIEDNDFKIRKRRVPMGDEGDPGGRARFMNSQIGVFKETPACRTRENESRKPFRCCCCCRRHFY